jgi:hypothetical protein
MSDSLAAHELRGRVASLPLERFGAATLRRRDLIEPALKRLRMAYTEAQEGHRSGSGQSAQGRRSGSKSTPGKANADAVLTSRLLLAEVVAGLGHFPDRGHILGILPEGRVRGKPYCRTPRRNGPAMRGRRWKVYN